jgi:hypothetical protein
LGESQFNNMLRLIWDGQNPRNVNCCEPALRVDPATGALLTTGGVGGGLTDAQLRSEPVSVTQLASTAAAFSKFRAPTSAPLTNAAQAIKASAGNVFGVRIHSPAGNVIPTYIKFFNVAAASVVVGTTVPVLVLPVPAYDGTNTGHLLIVPGPTPIENFSTAISAIATSVLADTGAQTAPTTGVIAEIHYA